MVKRKRQLLIFYLKQYLRHKPIFLSLIRSKEACLFSQYAKLKPPILDFGCGDGFFAKVIFANSLKLKENVIDIGLDLKKSRMEEAKKLGIYKKSIAYGGEEIPFAKNYFATVFSNCTLEHVENLKIVLSEIHRVLKPQGFFYTTVMTKEWEKNLFGSLVLGNRYKKWMRKKQAHLNLLANREWNIIFEKAGFTIVKRIGYLSPGTCRLIDICHYLSLPSLATYQLFRKWVLFPKLSQYLPVRFMASVLGENVCPDRSGALFYILGKS